MGGGGIESGYKLVSTRIQYPKSGNSNRDSPVVLDPYTHLARGTSNSSPRQDCRKRIAWWVARPEGETFCTLGLGCLNSCRLGLVVAVE